MPRRRHELEGKTTSEPNRANNFRREWPGLAVQFQHGAESRRLVRPTLFAYPPSRQASGKRPSQFFRNQPAKSVRGGARPSPYFRECQVRLLTQSLRVSPRYSFATPDRKAINAFSVACPSIKEPIEWSRSRASLRTSRQVLFLRPTK